jgi:hypothetical protein
MVPERPFEAKEREQSWVRPEITVGSEPINFFALREREMTLPAPEQLRPVHTGEEHFEATFAQFHSENFDWMLVELIRAHKAVFSSGGAEGERLGWRVGITVGLRVGMMEHS